MSAALEVTNVSSGYGSSMVVRGASLAVAATSVEIDVIPALAITVAE